MLAISIEDFEELYKDDSVLEYSDIFYRDPKSDKEYIDDYLSSKLWRLNNLYTIIDKQGKKVKLNMNYSQHKVYAESLRHSRVIVLKSRQQGISTLWLISFFDDALFNPHFSCGLMAQGQDESEKLLKKTKLLWEEFPQGLKDYFNFKVTIDNTKEFSFNNGSSIFVRTSFRSTTLQRLHISEFGKIANKSPDKAEETMTGTLQAIASGNTTIIESTAEGENLFKNLWDKASSYAGKKTDKDFSPVFLSWLDDKDCNENTPQNCNEGMQGYFDSVEEDSGRTLTDSQKNFWITKHRELGDKIYQEYPATHIEAFLKNREGAYYAKSYIKEVKNAGRERNDLLDSKLPLHVAIDLGMNDLFVLVFFQVYNKEWRVIDSYNSHGEDIKHYCNVMREKEVELGMKIDTVYLPHDAEVRELTSNKTRAMVFQEKGFKCRVVKKTLSINNDIDLVRTALMNFYIQPKAQYIINCLLNYSKEWDDKRGIWKNNPKHDLYSHGADTLRLMVRTNAGTTTVYPKNINRSGGMDM